MYARSREFWSGDHVRFLPAGDGNRPWAGVANCSDRWSATRPAYNSVAFIYEEVVAEVIEKGDRHSFSSPSDDKTKISEQKFTAHLQLVTVPMRDGYKWRVDDGGGPFTATMLDEAFAQKMQRNEIPFAPGDVLVARIRRQQFMQDQELHNESEILQVMRHEAAYRQIPLPIVRRED